MSAGTGSDRPGRWPGHSPAGHVPGGQGLGGQGLGGQGLGGQGLGGQGPGGQGPTGPGLAVPGPPGGYPPPWQGRGAAVGWPPAAWPVPGVPVGRPPAAGRGRRLLWLLVLAVGLALFLMVLQVLVSTGNPNFIPSVILLGACVVPAAFVTYAAGRGGWQVPAAVLAAAVLFGGVVGTVLAGWLEYDTMRRLGVLPMALVGLIEEAAKLLVPVAVGLWWWRRRRVPVDGLVVGVAVGMGFAALETMGYAFVTLIASRGDVGQVERLLLLRGLLSPAGHAAWTGLACAALWRAAARTSTRSLAGLAATFLGVVVLHTAWDSLGGLTGYLVVGAISVGWLLWEFHRADRALPFRSPSSPAPAAG